MLKPLVLIALTFAATPALAAATPWQDLAPGARARLISDDAIAGGRTRLGLELDMPADTKTYWRIPGETGIPAQFDFAGSTGLSDPAIQWPYPQIDDSDGFRDYVYRGHVVLPVSFAASSDTATLNAAIMLGVCSDICVPAQVKFTLPLNLGEADSGQSIRLDQAQSALPIDWDQPQPPFGAITATPDGIDLAGLDPAIDPQSLIADVGDPAILFAAPQKSPDGASWALKLLGETGAGGLAGRSLQLTFMTPRGPYAVTRTIAASP